MNYQETLEYLYHIAPLFQQVGQGAYKEGLSNTLALDNYLGHPHRKYQTIHVAGTNGKGSCSHTLASILQHAGFRVGLYTSPHLVDFRERIRVNGQMIPEDRVIDFVAHERAFFENLHPSFFELTTALAFKYFEEQKIDIAVIEVGLGGRLDCTNIITPLISVITNISLDHTQFLGNTLPQIAAEKAGIIKPNVPVVIGETGGNQAVKEVFLQKAEANHAPIYFADEANVITDSKEKPEGGWIYTTRQNGILEGELGGLCQIKNTATILCAIEELRKQSLSIPDKAVQTGFAQICETTGLMGRWQIISRTPLTICDTGHNPGGLIYICKQLETKKYRHLHIVIGMVSDKDVRHSLGLLPKTATFYFTQASVQRSLPTQDLARLGKEQGLNGNCFPNVKQAYEAAAQEAANDDLIYVGGSTFVVADFLASQGV